MKRTAWKASKLLCQANSRLTLTMLNTTTYLEGTDIEKEYYDKAQTFVGNLYAVGNFASLE
jgi:hypothetical protein